MTSSLCCPAPLVSDLRTGGDLRFQHLPVFGFFFPPGICTLKQHSPGLVAVSLKKNRPRERQMARIFSLFPRHSALDVPAMEKALISRGKAIPKPSKKR